MIVAVRTLYIKSCKIICSHGASPAAGVLMLLSLADDASGGITGSYRFPVCYYVLKLVCLVGQRARADCQGRPAGYYVSFSG